MVFKPVRTKQEFVRRFMADEFGNRGPNWKTLEEYQAAHYQGLVHIRNKQPGGVTLYDVPQEEVAHHWKRLHCSEQTHYLAGMAPTHLTLFQGEVQRRPEGLTLYYSQVPLPMRDSLALGGRTVLGILALSLLQHYLCSNSYEWLQFLLDHYVDHVIEFSTYGQCWGTVPNFNTVFWEVRLY